MRALAILPLVPWPPDQGDRLRAWEMLTALAAQGELTMLLLVAPPPAALQTLRGLGAVAILPLSRARRWRAGLVAALAGRPPAIAAYWDPSALAAVAGAAPGPWDLVCAFQLRAAPYALRIPARRHVLELTDALGLYRRQLPARGRAGLQRLALHGIEGLEATLPPRFDQAWISTPADADWIEHLSGHRPLVVPNGCLPVGLPAPYRADGPVLFVGNMRYPPNEDAVLWFGREVWPAARAAGLRRLRLVGRTTGPVRALARRPGVEVAGWVPDVGAELAAAAVAINPVRYGTGTNRKVLDAWAAARPVVSTTAGARGFSCVPGRDLLLADAPADWVAALIGLARGPEAAAALGRRGWEFAREAADSRVAWEKAVRAEADPHG